MRDGGVTGGIVEFSVTAEDKRHACDMLLELLRHRTDGRVAADLATGVAQLGPTAQDRQWARETLLRLLADQTDLQETTELASAVARLALTTEDKNGAREGLLRLLAPIRRCEVIHLCLSLRECALHALLPGIKTPPATDLSRALNGEYVHATDRP